jgi:hypothetical protein
MQTLFEVQGNHPVLKRVDEHRLTEVEKNDLVAELKKSGYEEPTVFPKIYLEDGDSIYITKKMYDLACTKAKENIYYMFDGSRGKFDKPFPFIGKISAKRFDRFMGRLIITWEGAKEGLEVTNTHWLADPIEGLGLLFIQPEFEELSIMNCNTEWLTEKELVIKEYALQNGLPEKESRFLIDIVESAMGKHGIVFYRP